MPTTRADTALVVRLCGTSGSVPLGPRSGPRNTHAAFALSPELASLAVLGGNGLDFEHEGPIPSENEAHAFLSRRLPRGGPFQLDVYADFDPYHKIVEWGWLPVHPNGGGYGYAFPLRENGAIYKRSLMVEGQAVTAEFFAVVQSRE